MVPQRASRRAGQERRSWLCRIHGNRFGVGGTELSSPFFPLRIYDSLVQLFSHFTNEETEALES